MEKNETQEKEPEQKEEELEEEPENGSETEEIDWQAEATKWTAIAKRKEIQKEVKPEVKEETSEIDDILELQAEGYSPAEIKTIKQYSKRMNANFSEVLKDPYIKSGILAEREKNKTQNATPPSSSRVFTVGDTKKSFSDMNKEERKKAFDSLQLKNKLKN